MAFDIDRINNASGFFILGDAALGQSGFSGAALGDINNDGVDDFAVTSFLGDGEVDIIFGSTSGLPFNFDLADLDGTNGYSIAGIDNFGGFGRSISGAGDINDDGIADFIVSAPGADITSFNDGAAYVIFGSDTFSGASLDLATLDGTNGFRVNGDTGFESLGEMVSAAGDVNNDGVDDLLISIPSSDDNANNAGETIVLFGSSTGFAATIDKGSISGQTFFGSTDSELAGRDISRLSDVNGDGIDDYLVAALGYSENASTLGAAYVVFGTSTGLPATLEASALNGSNGFRVKGTEHGNQFAFALDGIGDFNGDGLGDFAIGANRFEPAGSSLNGRVYVIFGDDQGFAADFDVTTLDGTNGFTLTGTEFETIGDRLEGLGDVNGDGHDDFAVATNKFDVPGGAQQRGFHVVFGTGNPVAADISTADLDSSQAITLTRPNGLLVPPLTPVAAGDLNGDGLDDIAITRTSADVGTLQSAGITTIIYGSTDFGRANDPVTAQDDNLNIIDDTTVDLAADNGNGADTDPDFGTLTITTLAGTAVNEGDSVTLASGVVATLLGQTHVTFEAPDVPRGTVFNDTFDYIVSDDQGSTDSATVTLQLTEFGVELADIDGSNGARINAGADNSRFGLFMSAIGDINGDGFDDIIVTDERDFSVTGDKAEAYVFFGSATGIPNDISPDDLDGSNGFRLFTSRDTHGLRAVSGGGDFNDDGIADLIVADNGISPNVAGSVHVVFGSLGAFAADLDVASLDGSNGFTLDTPLDATGSGTAVAAIGDVNDDNIDDFAVGLPGMFVRAGETYVIFGDTGPRPANTDITTLAGSGGFKLTGSASFSDNGFALAPLGDFDGDGIDDFVVSEFLDDELFVIYGQSGGFAATTATDDLTSGEATRFTAPVGVTSFGIVFGGAGDFNGDGFGDFITGHTFPEYINIIFGQSGGLGAEYALTEDNGPNHLRITGFDIFDVVGSTVDFVGDVNGDGLDDVGISAVAADPDGRVNAGEAYIIFGRSELPDAPIDISRLTADQGMRLEGEFDGDSVGAPVTAAGDVNGDGANDLLVAATGADRNGNADAGQAYVLYGEVNEAPRLGSSSEFLVNTEVASNQVDPSVAGLANGGFAAVWTTTDQTQDGDDRAVKGQVFDGSGEKVGSEFLVNETTEAFQFLPILEGLSDGGFVAGWRSDTNGQAGVLARVFDQSGSPRTSEFLVNQPNGFFQFIQDVTALPDGKFVFSWVSNDNAQLSSPQTAKARVFNSDGSPATNEFVLNGAADDRRAWVSSDQLENGNLVFVWATSPDNAISNQDIVARIFDASGAPVTSEFSVAQFNSSTQQETSVAALPDGGFVSAWFSFSSPDDAGGISIRFFNADGSPRTNEITANQSSSHIQSSPTLSVLNGEVFLSWVNHDPNYDGSISAIVARRFDFGGNSLGDEFTVNSETIGQQTDSTTTRISDTSAVVAWTSWDTAQDGDGSAVKARIFNADHYTYPENATDPVADLTASDDNDDEGDGLSYSITGNGADDAHFAIDTATGVLSFIAPPNFEAPDDQGGDNTYEVEIEVADSGGLTDARKVSVTVTDQPDAPVAAPDAATGTEDETLTVDVLANDTAEDSTIDPASLMLEDADDASGLTITLTGEGVWSVANGALEFAPEPDVNGPLTSVEYTVADDTGTRSDPALVTASLAPVNDLPVANDDDYATDQGIAVPVDPTSNDTDVDDDPLDVLFFGEPVGGTITEDEGTGDYIYTPFPNFVGTDSFTYTLTDSTDTPIGDLPVGNITITVADVNEAPVAVDDVIGITEDFSGTTDLLANDTDPENNIDPASVELDGADADTNGKIRTVSGEGVWQVLANGVLQFTPEPDYDGPLTSVAYTVADTEGLRSDPATVSGIILGENDAPRGRQDQIITDEDTTTAANLFGDNGSGPDTDPEGDAFFVSSINGDPANVGTDLNLFGDSVLNVSDSGDLSFDPGTAYQGLGEGEQTVLSFIYGLTDENEAEGNPVPVDITITGVNDAPVAADFAFTVVEGGSDNGNINATDVDDGIDDDSLEIVDADPGSNGKTRTVAGEGIWQVSPGNDEISFTPEDENFEGPVTPIQYTVADFFGARSNPATASVTIIRDEDNPETFPVTLDPITEDDVLTVTLVEGAAGPDELSISDLATDPDTPITPADLTFELSGSQEAGLAYDPTTGVLTFDPTDFTDPSISYQMLNDGDQDFAEITFRVFEGSEQEAENFITIPVDGVNDAPVANDDTGSVPEDNAGAAPIEVALNDTDLEDVMPNGAVRFVDADDGSDGQTKTVPGEGVWQGYEGSVEFLPEPDYTGPVTPVMYRIEDSNGALSNPAEITVSILPEDDAPRFVVDGETPDNPEYFFSIDENQPVSLTTAAIDPDGDPVTYALDPSAPALFQIDPDTGEITNTGPVDFETINAADPGTGFAFEVFASDGGNESRAQVFIDVVNIDEPVSITSPDTFTVPSDATIVGTLTGEDDDNYEQATSGIPLSGFLVVGGVDAGAFEIIYNTETDLDELAFVPDAPADSNGDGTYEVEIELANVDTDGGNSGTPATQSVTVIREAAETGRVFGYVFDDLDMSNSYYEEQDQLVEGVTVHLLNSDLDTVQSTVTNAIGHYKFFDVAFGEYTLEFELPPGSSFAVPDQGPVEGRDSDVTDTESGLTDPFTVDSEDIVRIQAGLRMTPLDTGDGSVRGYVFSDLNDDNVFSDDLDAKLTGVSVRLLDPDFNVLRTVTTGFTGNYRFDDLPYGDYLLQVLPDEGLAFVTPDQGSIEGRDSDITNPDFGTSDLFTVNSPDIVRLQAGVEDALLATSGDIRGSYFSDLDGDGIFTNGVDTRLAGRSVDLLDDTGAVVRSTVTSAFGTYRFDDVDFGTYQIAATPEPGEIFVAPDQGSIEGRDSDITDPVNGTTDPFVLAEDTVLRFQIGVDMDIV